MASSTAQSALTIVGSVVGTALVAWPIFIWWEVSKLEKPKYRVLKTLDTTSRFAPPVEVRRYEPYMVAEVTFDKSETPEMKAALSNGFRSIAQYIFDSEGKGQQDDSNREKIAMTSPVAAQMCDNSYKVAFVMPSKYSKESIPTPKNGKVVIKSVDAHTLAALSFRGRSPREQEVERRRQQLLDILKKHDISVPAGADTRVNQYHPPFAPSWQRLNEVLLPVDIADAS